MHIIAHFPIFFKISRSCDDEKHKGGQEEGDVVEVDDKQ